MCNVQCAICNVQFAMCNVQCAMCNVRLLCNSKGGTEILFRSFIFSYSEKFPEIRCIYFLNKAVSDFFQENKFNTCACTFLVATGCRDYI